MINEEIANKVVSIEINVLKATYQEILNNINKLHHRSKQHGSLGKLVKAEGNEVKLKDMVKKGQLEEIPVEEAELKEMKKELNELKKNKKMIVSEHAILRYLERTLGLDLKVIENEILTDDVVKQYKVLGNGKYPMGNGYKAVIKDNVVLTIVE